MAKLFNESEMFVKERPKDLTDMQESKMYSEIAQEIIDEGYSDSDIVDIISDIKEISFNISGFEIAKSLDDDYKMEGSYKINGDFVDYLDDLSSKRQGYIEENVKAWVKAHNPINKFNKGDRLQINKALYFKLPDGIIYINGVKKETAEYVVDRDKERKGGVILNFEEIEEKCEISK